MSKVDPTSLRKPENMSAAIIAKVHAENQIYLHSVEIRILQKRKMWWRKRYADCLKAIRVYAK